MKTQRLDCSTPEETRQSLAAALEILRGGGIVAIPTETVYGLAGDGLNPAALERIFAAKERPHADPLILHVGHAGDVQPLTAGLPETAGRLMERFWPGPLTLVLPKSPLVPSLVTAGLDSVAVRMPFHPLALELLRALGRPLAAPSANLFTRPSPTTADHVLEDLDGRIDAVLDGGATTVGVESTVLDLTVAPPLLLRPGGIPLEQLQDAIGEVRTVTANAVSGGAMRSPGLSTRHYSPRAEVRLYSGTPEIACRAIAAAARALPNPQEALIAAYSEDLPHYHDLPVRVESLGISSNPAAVAQQLYAWFRNADREGVRIVFVRLMNEDGLGAALNDRLRRAAAGRIVTP